MKNLKNLLISLTVYLLTTAAQATIVKDGCIRKIGEVLNHLPKKGVTVAIFDWDDSISSKNGEYDMREPDSHTGTLAVMKHLHTDNINTMVLTNRLAGIGIQGDEHTSEKQVRESLDGMVNSMTNALKSTNWLNHGAIKNNDLTELDLQPTSDYDDYILIKNQIAFSGGASGKGEAISKFLFAKMFKEKPDNILFIDNKKANIDEVREEFDLKLENVYLFYYPAANDKPQCDEHNAIK